MVREPVRPASKLETKLDRIHQGLAKARAQLAASTNDARRAWFQARVIRFEARATKLAPRVEKAEHRAERKAVKAERTAVISTTRKAVTLRGPGFPNIMRVCALRSCGKEFHPEFTSSYFCGSRCAIIASYEGEGRPVPDSVRAALDKRRSTPGGGGAEADEIEEESD